MRYIRTICLLTVVLMVFAGVASAEPVPLESLLDGGTIIIGDKVFGDFGFACTTGAGTCIAAGITPSVITVEASIGDTGVYFLRFLGDMITDSDVDFALQYSVTASAGLITEIDQSFQLSATGQGGTIIIAEDVRAGSFEGQILANSSVGFFLELDCCDPDGEPLQGDDLIIEGGLVKAWVTKDISLDPNEGGVVGTSVLIQSFHQTVPEPTSLILLGTGLAGLAIWRKRSK